jgi:hypothetical protein
MADQRANDRRIKEILVKYGEDLTGSVWRVQGTAVINHKALERIAAKAQIRFDEPKIIRAERDEAVIQVTGRLGERVEWTIGEALIKGESHAGNYQVSGKQAAYVYAMAEKRAKDRLILKLIELHGFVYSEEEADEFKRQGTRTQDQMGNDTTEHDEDGVIDDDPPATDNSAVRGSTEAGTEAYSGAARVGQKPEDSVAAKVKANIDKRAALAERDGKDAAIGAILDFMNAANTVDALKNRMTKEESDDAHEHARKALVALGWSDPNKPSAKQPSSRNDKLKDDPYSKYSLQSLPTSISTAIGEAKTIAEMETYFDNHLTEKGLEWDKLPADLQNKLNELADKRAEYIKKTFA